MNGKIALVTGANRGLGFETAKKLAEMGCEVVIGSRDEAKGKGAAAKIKGGKVHVLALDSSKGDSVVAAEKFLSAEFGRLDILVNNAGVFLEDLAKPSAFTTTEEMFRKTFETNTLGPFLLCQKLIPLMVKNNWGRIVNVSSGMGQLTEMAFGSGYPAYRMSKSAVNMVTRVFSGEMQGKNILINSVCPGWVKTDMGGAGADRELSEGIAGIVWAATLPDGGPTGGFFRDGKPIVW